MSEEELQDLFGEYGEVTSAKIIKDRMTGRSRGFGFVEMAEEDAGKAAIEALNDKDFSGRPLRVNEARPQRERAPRGNSRRF